MRIFKSTGLSITVKTNLKIPNFLNIHFEIKDNIYQPYKTLNDEPLYINKNSNHPLTDIKQILKAISKQVSDISSSREIHDQNISYCQDAFKTQQIQ